MNDDRLGHTATLLPNNSVFVTGGGQCAPSCIALPTAEIYQPSSSIIDTTPPTTTATLPTSTNNSGWYNQPVNVWFKVGDPGGSGVVATYYAIDTPSCAPGDIDVCSTFTITTPATVSTQGFHTVYFFSTDYAGDNEAPQSVPVNIDETPPQTTASMTGPQIGPSTFAGPVGVTLSANDNLSGVASTTYRIDRGPVITYTAPFTIVTIGTHSITYISTDNAGNVEPTHLATITLTTPTIGVTPFSAHYGQTITIKGANFGPSEHVNLYVDSTKNVPLASTTTSTAGALVVAKGLPQNVYGPHSIVALGQTSGLSATADFKMTSLTVLGPTSGAPGAAIRVVGLGFGAQESIGLHWNTPTGALLATTTSNGLGSYGLTSAVTFTVPASPPSTYLIYGIGKNTHATSVSVFRVT
jgi:hypothetical protein